MSSRRQTPLPAADAGEHDEPAATARRSRAPSLGGRVGAVILGWTLVGLAQAVVWRISGRALFEREGLFDLAARPMAAAWTWAALTPFVVWLTRRLAHARLPALVAGHVAGALLACVAVTAVRVATSHLLGGTAWAPRQFVFWLDVNVATYLLVVAAVRAVDLHRGYAARMRRAIRLEAQLARARLQFLQRQLQPHFLFNCLNATAELTREAPEAAQRMLGHLARLLRAALEHQSDGEVTLRAELDALEPYVEIQRTRFGDAFDFAATVEPSALDARVPSLLLQPLVENAFRHGLAGRDRGRVRVRAAVVPGSAGARLRVEVADDGAGTGAHQIAAKGAAARSGKGSGGSASARRSGGIGLRNTRDRLRQLYGDDFRFELRQTPGTGTVVLLDIPYRPEDAPEVEPDTRFDTAEYAAVTAAAARAAESGAASRDAAPRAWPERTDGTVTYIPIGPTPPARPAMRGLPAPAAAAGRADDRAAAERDGRPHVPGWVRLAALWLCAAGFWTLQIWGLDLLDDGRIGDWFGSRRDVLGALEWALLTPLVLWLARRFRLTRRTWMRYLPLHVAFAGVVDVAQIAVMWQAFDPQFPLFHENFVSPFTVNFLIYAAIVAWAHARDFGAWLRDRELADARLEAQLAHARWQALALELRPQLVLTVLGVAARLAPENPARAERLIERLSDLLRAVLDASSEAMSSTAESPGAGAPAWQPQALRHELGVFGACAELLAEAVGHEAHVSLDADPAALDANLPPGAFGPLLDALVDALLVEAEVGAEAAVAVGAGPAAGPMFAETMVPGELRLGVLARATAGGVRVTVRADAPLFARLAPDAAGGTPSPSFPDAYTAVLDLAPDAGGGHATLTPITGVTAR